MKLIKGLEDAKKFLLDLRKFGIDNIPNETLELILESNKKIFGKKLSPVQIVEMIIDEVKIKGDKAVKKYTSKLDGFDIDQIKVSNEDIKEAYNKVPLKLIEWREWVTNFLSKDFSWERLKFMAKRIEKNNSNKSVIPMADSFLESIDSNLEKIYSKVSKNEIIKYEKDTIDITTKLIGSLIS